MKGEITLKIMECIKNASDETADAVAAFLAAGYGASSNKLNYKLSKMREARIDYDERQKFYKLIHKLEKDGLIEKSDRGKSLRLRLKSKGSEFLEFLRRKKRNYLSKPAYDSEKSDQMIIVIFDVPEDERRKRDWLRAALKNIGLKPVQKSVWAGKIKLPREFLNDAEKMHITSYLEIFEIRKAGSLIKIL